MSSQERYYLDYAATTPLDEKVLQAMLPYFHQTFGNPSSVHMWGQAAEAALEAARVSIAKLINASPDEIIFTSGGTESDNLALRGVAWAQRLKRGAKHLLVSPVEHPAVLNTARELHRMDGFELELLPVDENGRVDPESVRKAIRSDTALVSVIYASNEIGTINPVAEIGQMCHEKDVPFHSDAVQAAAHLKIDVQAEAIDLLSLGAHKFYGPKGVGALYVRKGTLIQPILTGGGQENGLRAGTSNIPYIVGMAEAFRLVHADMAERNKRYVVLRDHLFGEVLESVTQSNISGHPHMRLPNHASFVFKDIDGNQLLMMLDIAGFACSSGSACKTGSPKPSEVLLACGLSADWALGSLRITMGKDTEPETIEALLEALPVQVKRQRRLHGMVG
jgi:cysteine desulfurase